MLRFHSISTGYLFDWLDSASVSGRFCGEYSILCFTSPSLAQFTVVHCNNGSSIRFFFLFIRLFVTSTFFALRTLQNRAISKRLNNNSLQQFRFFVYMQIGIVCIQHILHEEQKNIYICRLCESRALAFVHIPQSEWPWVHQIGIQNPKIV